MFTTLQDKQPLPNDTATTLRELETKNDHLREQVRDLTLKLKKQEGLAESHEELFRSNPVALLVHDMAGTILEANVEARKLLGIRDHRHIYACVSQFVPADQVHMWLDHINGCVDPEAPLSTEMDWRLPNGRTPVELTTRVVRSDAFGLKHARYHTALRDITQRRLAETALAQSQSNYHKLVDAVEGIVWVADAATLEVQFVSQYAERLLGYPVAEWYRPGFWERHIYSEDREQVVNRIARALSKKEDLRMDYRALTATRELLWLHDSITFAEREGRPVLFGVAFDVTSRRRAEEELMLAHGQSERLVAERTTELQQSVAELEAFSYSVSHDLRAPVRAMAGYAALALRHHGEQLPAEVKGYLDRILDGANRADMLIRDVLTYSRLSKEQIKLEPVDLEQLLRDLISQFPEFHPPAADIQINYPLLPVIAHPACLGRCVANLLTNAVKFVAPGTRPAVQIWTELIDGMVRLWFKDNGIGIEPHFLGRLFGIFERASKNYEGTGIGLAIVRRGIQRLGGQVGVESQPGRGSKFWIQLNGVE